MHLVEIILAAAANMELKIEIWKHENVEPQKSISLQLGKTFPILRSSSHQPSYPTLCATLPYPSLPYISLPSLHYIGLPVDPAFLHTSRSPPKTHINERSLGEYLRFNECLTKLQNWRPFLYLFSWVEIVAFIVAIFIQSRSV